MSATLTETFFDGREEAGLLTRLRRRKGLFVSVFVLAAGAVGGIYAILPSSYLASGAVMVTAYPLHLGAEVAAAEQNLGDPADLDSQIIVATSPRLLKEMLRRPGIAQALQADCEARQGSPVNRLLGALRRPVPCASLLADGGALGWLQDHFVVGSAGKSRVIEIDYKSHRPDVAAILVNGLIDTYLEQAKADKQRSRTEAETWIHAELDRIGGELRQSELELENFRHDHGLVRGETASLAAERLTQVSQQLTAAEAAWSVARASVDQLRSGAADSRQTLESRTVADLKQQLSEISGQVARMASVYRPSHPELLALEQQRDELQQRIAQETGRIRASVERDYASATDQVASLRRQLDGLKQDVGVGDLAETQIASMVRDDDVKRELYVDLSKKANDLEAQRRLLTGDVQLVNYAEVPTRIVSPKLPLFALAGLFVGVIAASAAALMRDRSDPAVRGSGRLQLLSGAAVLGHIPYVGRLRGLYARGAGRQLGRPSALQEAVRALYTKCVLLGGPSLGAPSLGAPSLSGPSLGGPDRPRTLLLTSAETGEGKTFLTLAMAQFGAATGQRILAVEADLRQPDFRAALGLADGPGLADLLRGEIGHAAVVRPSGFGFDVLPAGAATIASTELLSNGRIAALLDWARDKYDLVLIDSPPAQVLMDAHVLASRVDGVLYCARWGHSSVETVADSVRSLRLTGARIVGLALGMVDPREYALYAPSKLPRGPYLMAPS